MDPLKEGAKELEKRAGMGHRHNELSCASAFSENTIDGKAEQRVAFGHHRNHCELPKGSDASQPARGDITNLEGQYQTASQAKRGY